MALILRPIQPDKHAGHIGADLHIARAFTQQLPALASNPRDAADGNLRPTIVGEFFWDSVLETLWLANGLTVADWLVVRDKPKIATATALFSSASLVDVQVTGMGFTLTTNEEGLYLVMFCGSYRSTTAGANVFASIHVGGVQVVGSERQLDNTNTFTPFACLALATVVPAQTIQGRARTSGPGSVEVTTRNLFALRLA